MGSAFAALLLFFLLATPYYKIWEAGYPGDPGLTTVRLQLLPGPETFRVIQVPGPGPALQVRAVVQGFGFPKLKLSGRLQAERQGATLTARAGVLLAGLVTERRGEIEFRVRSDLALAVSGEGLNTDVRLGEWSRSDLRGARGRTGPGPNRYAALNLSSLRGGILLQAHPGSRCEGPVRLVTRQGDIRVVVKELADPGPDARWEVGTDKGRVLVEAEQTRTMVRPLSLRAWSRWGDAACVAKVSPESGLDVAWEEGAGRSGLQAEGRWHQQGNHAWGPVGMHAPGLRIYLAVSNGLLGIQLNELGPGARAPWPTAEPTPMSLSPAEDLPPPIKPTAEESEPDWMRRELINLPTGPPPKPSPAPSPSK